jgi:hypothetical protein
VRDEEVAAPPVAGIRLVVGRHARAPQPIELGARRQLCWYGRRKRSSYGRTDDGYRYPVSMALAVNNWAAWM